MKLTTTNTAASRAAYARALRLSQEAGGARKALEAYRLNPLADPLVIEKLENIDAITAPIMVRRG